jgi:hypothetical protein
MGWSHDRAALPPALPLPRLGDPLSRAPSPAPRMPPGSAAGQAGQTAAPPSTPRTPVARRPDALCPCSPRRPATPSQPSIVAKHQSSKPPQTQHMVYPYAHTTTCSTCAIPPHALRFTHHRSATTAEPTDRPRGPESERPTDLRPPPSALPPHGAEQGRMSVQCERVEHGNAVTPREQSRANPGVTPAMPAPRSPGLAPPDGGHPPVDRA